MTVACPARLGIPSSLLVVLALGATLSAQCRPCSVAHAAAKDMLKQRVAGNGWFSPLTTATWKGVDLDRPSLIKPNTPFWVVLQINPGNALPSLHSGNFSPGSQSYASTVMVDKHGKPHLDNSNGNTTCSAAKGGLRKLRFARLWLSEQNQARALTRIIQCATRVHNSNRWKFCP